MAKSFTPTYTIGFVGAVAVVCSLLLSLAATALKPRQDQNVELEIKKNILKSFEKLPEKASAVQVIDFFKGNIEGLVVTSAGEAVADVAVETVKPEDEEKDKGKAANNLSLPLYILKEDGAAAAYAVPVFGKGLWSTLRGYLSLEKDLRTIRGLTFYDQGETPGLGAEIGNSEWQAKWRGKLTLDETGKLVSVMVVKGKVLDRFAPSDPMVPHCVDGISGATLTCKGVTALLAKDLAKYEPYFKTLRP